MEFWGKSGRFVSQLLLAMVCTTFALSFAILVTVNFRPLYYWDVGRLRLEDVADLSGAEIRKNYDAMVDYLWFFHDEPLVLPSFPMSESGRIHFEDVKNLVDKAFLACASSLVLGGLWIVVMVRRRNQDRRFLFLSSILTFALPTAIGVWIATNWENAFVTFHETFFHNDYWWFDKRTDPVITILPDSFFLHCAILFLALVILGGVLSLIIYRRLGKEAPATSPR